MSTDMNYPLSKCCGADPIGEIHDSFAFCSRCKEMAEFEDCDESPELTHENAETLDPNH